MTQINLIQKGGGSAIKMLHVQYLHGVTLCDVTK